MELKRKMLSCQTVLEFSHLFLFMIARVYFITNKNKTMIFFSSLFDLYGQNSQNALRRSSISL